MLGSTDKFKNNIIDFSVLMAKKFSVNQDQSIDEVIKFKPTRELVVWAYRILVHDGYIQPIETLKIKNNDEKISTIIKKRFEVTGEVITNRKLTDSCKCIYLYKSIIESL